MAEPIENQNNQNPTGEKPSRVKQILLWVGAAIGVILTIYNAGQGITSYAEWKPHLIIGFKPPPPDILNTEFSLKNNGKFMLRGIKVKAQLFYLEYGDGVAIEAETFGKLFYETPFSNIGDIPAGDERPTRPLTTLTQKSPSPAFTLDQWKIVSVCLQVSFSAWPFSTWPFSNKEQLVGLLADKRVGINEWMKTPCDTAKEWAYRAQEQHRARFKAGNPQ
jgi:hypothetical protein